MNLNEKQLEEAFNAEVFPIYIYWDSAKEKFFYRPEKRDDFIGIIYKNPIKKIVNDLNYTISPEDALKINEIIIDQSGVEEKEVVPNASLYDNLGLDSLDFDELVIKLETAFLISIPYDVAQKVRRVQDVYAVVAKILAEKK